jgi:hypothetical protein
LLYGHLPPKRVLRRREETMNMTADLRATALFGLAVAATLFTMTAIAYLC